jgi:UDP-N-acetylmuramate--alanine ligase
MSMPGSRLDPDAPVPPWHELGAVHFVAIGGAGMSAVARLYLGHGAQVSGSDAVSSPTLDSLRAAGARVALGQRPENLADADTVVFSSAVREDNPELVAARRRGLRVLHRSQALAALLTGSRAVAVAGANGKTTTTAMLLVGLAEAGADPSFACGGEIAALGTNAALGTGDAFVVEADESDGSFLVYRPEIAVVTNVQPDHLDFYGTADNVARAYRRFVGTVRPGGVLVTSVDDDGARHLADVAARGGTRVLTFGCRPDADLRIGSIEPVGLGSRTDVVDRGVRRDLVLAVPGAHNVADAAAAYLAATAGLGADPEAVLRGLAGFTGVRRRFEVRGRVGEVTVVDDYAHNPAKVAAVVATAADVLRRRGSGRLRVVFQPHLYSRTRDFAADFAESLAPADHVVLLDIYGARESPVPGITSALVGEPLRGLPGRRWVQTGLDPAEAVAAVAQAATPGDIVLTVGAGDVTGLGPHLLDALAARAGVRP